MNTTQLKKFAAEARTILKEGVINRLDALGFDHKGHVSEEDRPTKGQGFVLFRGDAMPDDGFFERWQSLYERVQQKGIQEVYEEAAYTWFNRLMAIRIMAKNGFIAPVLEYVSESTRIPVILSQAREGQFPEMSAAERQQLMAIIDDGRKSQEQFAILITAYCHANPVINKCFGGVTDYTTLLLPQNIIAEGGFIDLLNNTPFIDDEDYKSAELIGWLYQYYVSERHDEVYKSFDEGNKAEAKDIPPATQIFTPNWIVKYMVQNTLGRIYLDNNPYDTDIRPQMQYLVESIDTKNRINYAYKYSNLEELRLGDLACGSGHILNEFFDLMYLFYIEEGYSRRNAIENIFLKNLTGIDLDTRAKQLAQFALMVKACQKDPSFLDARVMPNVLDMPTPLDINKVKATLPEFFLGGNMKMLQETEDAFELLQQAENLGSIMKFNISDSTRAAIEIRMKEWEAQPAETVSDSIKALLHSFRLILALTGEYTSLVANPPYMGSGKMNESLKDYLGNNYTDTKKDLFSVFMQMMIEKTAPKGRTAFITMESWMFLASYDAFRDYIIDNFYIESLGHFGWHIIGIAFGTAMCVIEKAYSDGRKGEYSFLTINDIDRTLNVPFSFPRKDNGKYSIISQEIFRRIPGNPIAYYLPEQVIESFKEENYIYSHSIARSGFSTGKNDIFCREWYEVNISKIAFGLSNNQEFESSKCKYVPFTAGGTFRRWYGNLNSVVDWTRRDEMHRPRNTYMDLYYKPAITWNAITAGNLSCRKYNKGFLFEHAAATLFVNEGECEQIYLAFLNTNVLQYLKKILNPTLNNGGDVVSSVPILTPEGNIKEIVDTNVNISKQDWDAHETSWDFQQNELLSINGNNYLDIIDDYADFNDILIEPSAPEQNKLEWHYNMFVQKWETLFYRLKRNEEYLNHKFIETYGLQRELEEFVKTSDITILQQGEISIVPAPNDDSGYGDTITFNKDEVIKQLISYAIGCWMGRYRLDKLGLYIAHPDAKPEEIVTYEYNGQSFEIDDDGIIPLLPAYASFPDNGYKRIQDFVRIAFGAETLTENINFIEEALGMTLEKFMMKEFWKYHKKMYQNRPIYWLFSSKKGAFQCLTYMHRMNAYTAEQVRSKYLLPHIEWLKNHIAEMEARASQLTTQERRQKDQMAKDLKECLEYHDELHVVADHNISFNLDDGVVKNYALFGNVLAKLK